MFSPNQKAAAALYVARNSVSAPLDFMCALAHGAHCDGDAVARALAALYVARGQTATLDDAVDLAMRMLAVPADAMERPAGYPVEIAPIV